MRNEITGCYQPKKGEKRSTILITVDTENIMVNGGGIIKSKLRVIPKEEEIEPFIADYTQICFDSHNRKRLNKVINDQINRQRHPAENERKENPVFRRATIFSH
ncbi:MAG: hypothetical protein WC146_00490 [Patescibacteria group bacterium]|jgi:hypothetical protein